MDINWIENKQKMDINLIETRRKWIETGQKQNRLKIDRNQGELYQK